MADLLAAVAAALRDAADQAIVPRFRTLERSAIVEKSPGDWVTDADREAEELITRALSVLTPGVPVVAEEASAADPTLVAEGHRHDAVWVLDPLDGTTSFIAGDPDFATMCALVEDGVVSASWIWQPVRGQMFTASRGGGAFVDGVPIARERARVGAPASLQGVLRTRYMPPELRRAALDGFEDAGLVHAEVSAAGVVYPMAARGQLSHALYWRTLPWDHAPGTLLAEEAGLVVARLDRTPYRPWDGRFGLLSASDQRAWDVVRAALPSEIDDSSTE